MITKKDVLEVIEKLEKTNDNFVYAEGTELHNSIKEGYDISNRIMKFVVEIETKANKNNAWHRAVLDECIRVESCYEEDDPAQTVTNLINYHVAETKGELDAIKDKRNEYKPNATHWNQRIEELMKNTPWPESRSTAQAMQQLANEMEHAFFNGTYYKKE